MAGDKLFQKRRARRAKAAQREKKLRKESRRILIVCEGETEKGYFTHYAKKESDLLYHITSECGTSPHCVAEHALYLSEADGDFDIAFAVFDGDTADKGNYNKAIKSLSESSKVNAVPTTPCFEYWLLLHFTFSRRPYLGTSKAKSACTQILDELKKFSGMESYVKGEKLNFPAFEGKLDVAITHSKRAITEAADGNQRNPSSLIHVVIEAIQAENFDKLEEFSTSAQALI